MAALWVEGEVWMNRLRVVFIWMSFILIWISQIKKTDFPRMVTLRNVGSYHHFVDAA